LTFKATDDKYKVLLCTSTSKEKSPQNFSFAALTYDNEDKPTVEVILLSDFGELEIQKMTILNIPISN
jgi:hypothetical protein